MKTVKTFSTLDNFRWVDAHWRVEKWASYVNDGASDCFAGGMIALGANNDPTLDTTERIGNYRDEKSSGFSILDFRVRMLVFFKWVSSRAHFQ